LTFCVDNRRFGIVFVNMQSTWTILLRQIK
jgi:hypothetical protein